MASSSSQVELTAYPEALQAPTHAEVPSHHPPAMQIVDGRPQHNLLAVDIDNEDADIVDEQPAEKNERFHRHISARPPPNFAVVRPVAPTAVIIEQLPPGASQYYYGTHVYSVRGKRTARHLAAEEREANNCAAWCCFWCCFVLLFLIALQGAVNAALWAGSSSIAVVEDVETGRRLALTFFDDENDADDWEEAEEVMLNAPVARLRFLQGKDASGALTNGKGGSTIISTNGKPIGENEGLTGQNGIITTNGQPEDVSTNSTQSADTSGIIPTNNGKSVRKCEATWTLFGFQKGSKCKTLKKSKDAGESAETTSRAWE